jgi:hypothetical protein
MIITGPFLPDILEKIDWDGVVFPYSDKNILGSCKIFS